MKMDKKQIELIKDYHRQGNGTYRECVSINKKISASSLQQMYNEAKDGYGYVL